MNVSVQKLTQKQLESKGVFSWPIWEKEVSRFDWSYDSTEQCYFLSGKVTVETSDGQTIDFGTGDFVTFPQGLSCVWNIKEPVKKHYHFD